MVDYSSWLLLLLLLLLLPLQSQHQPHSFYLIPLSEIPVGLSYPGLRCVLEHLDAVKRIHIASRCAVLRRCEKSIPLRLNYLCIGSELRLDYCSSWLSYEMELEFNDTRRTRVQTRDEPRSVLYAVSVPQNLDHQTVNEKINQYYLGGRTSVYVKRLDIFGSASSLAWSVDSMFKITELNAEDNYFEDFLPIIDPISFPLKSLQTKTAGLHTYDHPVFRSAEALSFNLFEEHSETEIICLHKLPCKTILFEYDLEWINIVRMIRYWMENPKEIGTKYTFVEYNRKLVYNELLHIKREFEGIRHDLNYKRPNTFGTESWPRFSIPLNATSKLLVYAIDTPCLNFILKVVPESETDFTGIEGEMAQLSFSIFD